MEICLAMDKAELRFIIEELGPEADVIIMMGSEFLGKMKMKELRHFTKALSGL